MVNYRYLGYGITDENGIATLDHDANGDPITHSYTGTGAGEIDIVASLDDSTKISGSSIQSEPYEVLDCIFYDDGVSETATWTQTNATMTVIDNTYTKIAKSGTSTATCTASATLTSKFAVEWHNHLDNDPNNYFLIDNNNYLGLGSYGIDADTDVKLIVEADNITPIVNGVTKNSKTININLSQGVNVALRVHSVSTHDLGFSNFKVYPI